MKIKFIVRNLNLGGIQRVVLDLASQMVKKGVEVELILLEKVQSPFEIDEALKVNYLESILCSKKAKVVRALNKVFPYVGTVFLQNYNSKILNEYLQGQADTDSCVFLCGFGALINFKAATIKANVYCVCHNMYSIMLTERTGFLKMVNVYILKRAVQGAKIYAISSSIKKDIVSKLGLNCRNEILYNPIDLQRVNLLSNERGKVFSNEIEGEYFIYVGRVSKEKNVEKLIQLFLKADLPKHKLLIVGNGELLEKIKNTYSNESVKFCGALRNPYALMKQSNALLLASDYEGMPTVALEALTLGRAVITTPIDGVGEELRNISTAVHVANSEQEFIRLLQEHSVKKLYDTELSMFERASAMERYISVIQDK